MPCARFHRHRFHHGHRHHPFWMSGQHGCRGAYFDALLLAKQMQDSNKATFDEKEEAFMIRMDVPGVKPDQITIEEKDGEMEIVAIRMNTNQVADTYQDVMYVDPYKADMDRATAYLTEGVLTIKIPKKVTVDSLELKAVATTPPEPDTSANEFHLTADIPGVKPSDLKLKVTNDYLFVRGERSIGQHVVITRRKFEIPRGVDMASARAYLMDGVFTVLAPKLELKPSALRTIHVNEAPCMEDLHIDDAEDAKKEPAEDEIMVETVVAEETEEKEWEQVDETNAAIQK